eukprot:2093238-Rhodomonas_salina.1
MNSGASEREIVRGRGGIREAIREERRRGQCGLTLGRARAGTSSRRRRRARWRAQSRARTTRARSSESRGTELLLLLARRRSGGRGAGGRMLRHWLRVLSSLICGERERARRRRRIAEPHVGCGDAGGRWFRVVLGCSSSSGGGGGDGGGGGNMAGCNW